MRFSCPTSDLCIQIVYKMADAKDFCTKNGSSQGQNLAVTGLFVLISLFGLRMRGLVLGFWVYPALHPSDGDEVVFAPRVTFE